MKKVINLGIIISLLCVTMFLPLTVHATSLLGEQLLIKSSENYAEDTQYVLQRASHLSHGNARIQELSANSISIYGLTQCHHICDNVYLSLYLERKVNGSYSTYKSWDYTSTSATSLSKSLIVSVPTGYYYRIRGYHAAKCTGSSKESITSLTEGVYVG